RPGLAAWSHDRPVGAGTSPHPVTRPRASIVLPAWNAGETLGESVASALAQTMGDFELLVVDDGSEVPAATTLAEVDDPRLRLITLPRNRGVARARNLAV